MVGTMSGRSRWAQQQSVENPLKACAAPAVWGRTLVPIDRDDHRCERRLVTVRTAHFQRLGRSGGDRYGMVSTQLNSVTLQATLRGAR